MILLTLVGTGTGFPFYVESGFRSGSAKAKCCASGSTVPQHCAATFLILAFLLYSGAGHSAVGEARLLRHGGHGGARLPPLGLSQAAVRGHAHHYRLHQVPYTPLKSLEKKSIKGLYAGENLSSPFSQ